MDVYLLVRKGRNERADPGNLWWRTVNVEKQATTVDGFLPHL